MYILGAVQNFLFPNYRNKELHILISNIVIAKILVLIFNTNLPKIYISKLFLKALLRPVFYRSILIFSYKINIT